MHSEPVRYLEPQTFTDLSPRALSAESEGWLKELKEELLESLAADVSGIPETMVFHALNEANSLAALTPFPLLFLPALAEEKLQAARVWSERQRRLLGGPEIALAA